MNEILFNLEKLFVHSLWLGLGASFLAGLLASFSPCVYPLIPITLSIVGAVSTTTRARGFLLSLIFVLGISFTYTLLGVITALLGVLFSSFFLNSWTYFILGIVFVLFGLSLLEIINLTIFSFAPQYSVKKGLVSLFFLGAVSGLAFIPCNFPVLGSILNFIMLRKNIFYGAAALFLFSLGFGFILLVVGTFSSLLGKLPKQGKWLVVIKKVLGVFVLLIGVYFLGKAILTFFK